MQDYVKHSLSALETTPCVHNVKIRLGPEDTYRFDWQYKGLEFTDFYSTSYNIADRTPEQVSAMCDNAMCHA